MKKTFLTWSLAAVVGTSSVFFPLTNQTKAESFEEKQAKIKNERSSVQSDISSKKNEIEKLEAEQAKLDAEIKSLDMKVSETARKIKEKEEQITKTKAEIESLKKQIAELQKRIDERNELLKDRAKSLQESGGVISYLDVLLGAQSFSDFVSRISAVTTIVEADKKIIEEHQRDMKMKEEAEAKLNQELTDLSEALKEYETLKMQLDAQIEEKNKMLKEVAAEHDHAMEELEELEEQDAFLAEQARIIAEQKKEYERRLAEQRKAAPASSSSPAVNAGGFIWPTAGYVSSKFGPRDGRLHAGIDIAKKGTVPVYAAASGTVIRAYYSSSYGNVVFISHNINGQVYTTVYAHLSSLGVSSGQRVSQGQFVGYMGNTGRSFGQHLHFEVHKGPWNASKSNAINPLSVLP
ncbi:murein hydrolase activator EnvC family protein [Bacillus alveayuensis]|uniref:murein hydrolase activator EnvC family protein n=1 Tax=Aeribacillus alveayuensis TaxID=279215 RepID=UPI0005CD7229|nr:peptidoglycan DD-metalloendopeptidase family protein [Bacillus alveayuensis]